MRMLHLLRCLDVVDQVVAGAVICCETILEELRDLVSLSVSARGVEGQDYDSIPR